MPPEDVRSPSPLVDAHQHPVVQHLDGQLVAGAATRCRGRSGRCGCWACRRRGDLADSGRCGLGHTLTLPSTPRDRRLRPTRSRCSPPTARPWRATWRVPAAPGRAPCCATPTPPTAATATTSWSTPCSGRCRPPGWPRCASTSAPAPAGHGRGLAERADVVAALDRLATEVTGASRCGWPATRSGPTWRCRSGTTATPAGWRWHRRCASAGPPRPAGGDAAPGAGVGARARPVRTARTGWARPPRAWPAVTVEAVPMADHFLAGATAQVAQRLTAWVLDQAADS